MQRIVLYSLILGLLSSCSVFRPATADKPVEKKRDPATISREMNNNITEDDASPVIKKRAKKNINYNIRVTTSSTLTENVSPLQLKYNQLLDQEVETKLNEKLYSFIDDWWGTPYRIGGMTRDGVDCSGFVFTLYISLYKIELPRTARDQRDVCRKISKSELREGDLVFFHTTRRAVSHVGVYLGNNKFVHASTSSGVMISDLDEEYWSKRFLGGGRYDSSKSED